MEQNGIGTVMGLILTTLVRYAVVAVTAWLVQHKIMTEGDAQAFHDPTTIAAIVAAVVTMGFGIYMKLRTHWKVATALKMPQGATPYDLSTVTNQTGFGKIISTTPPTNVEITTAIKRNNI